ncbi:RIP metalloprotease RseP [Novosphingobium flavum]|uniref:Zinc metalloprotease n=2 Tax=Novosphingobium flavum TaxID=1778672 RepID=A0A7X1FR51_9SPHN|nr:RIP metalloprotease RseP [Novosphingobium flavum]MBC2664867.1 RIP metalloprotease RseP [Novosphingobium flavum]
MILGFVLLLGPLVVIHELGHYLVGRWCGVKADAFSVGFGRELFGVTDRRGTRWKLSAIPLGGYVQFAGDMDPTSRPDDSKFEHLSADEKRQIFNAQPLWRRAAIVAAGPLTNLLFAVVIFAAFNMAYGKMVAPPVVEDFTVNSPAAAAGMLKGDRVLSIDGTAVDSFDDLRQHVWPWPDTAFTLVVERAGKAVPLTVKTQAKVLKDRFGNESRVGLIGIMAGRPHFAAVGPVEAVTLASKQTWGVMRMLVVGIRQIITGERSVAELGGPIKTAKYSGEQLSLGWLEFVSFAAFISINLAFINLLPIPALDGGHLAFYVAEAVRRRPLDARSQDWAYRTGLAFVVALMLFVTLNDLASLLPIGRS